MYFLATDDLSIFTEVSENEFVRERHPCQYCAIYGKWCEIWMYSLTGSRIQPSNWHQSRWQIEWPWTNDRRPTQSLWAHMKIQTLTRKQGKGDMADRL